MMHANDEQEFAVVLGTEAPLPRFQRTLLEACRQLVVHPIEGSTLLMPFAGRLVFVEIGVDASCPPGREPRRGCRCLVRLRHTPSATLRQIVSRTARSFGSVRLLVRRNETLTRRRDAVPFRTQQTSLAGFLRSGRVVQEDTLLHIVDRSHSSEASNLI